MMSATMPHFFLRALWSVLIVGALVGPLHIGSARAIDLETAIWYYERNQWVPAFLDFQILAAEGDPVAKTYMGRMFRRGWGVEKNLVEAERWLREGAEGGVPIAHHRRGWMYARGEIGDTRDNVNAVKHWKIAAESGLSLAQMDLGVMYWNGVGVQKDLILAYTWLSLASQDEELLSAKQNLDNLAEQMTQPDITQAKSLAEQIEAEINSKS